MERVTEMIPAESATILLAEDDAIVRKMVMDILTLGQYAVIPACDGEEAYNLFLQHEAEIDMVITDVVMPRMNGRQLGERCRLRNSETPILYMSGYVDKCLDPREAIKDRSDFIAKPFRPAEFLGRVGKLLGREDRGKEIRAAS